MTLPAAFAANNLFQKKDLTGLVPRGRCFVTDAWPLPRGGADVLACHGSHFAVIDDYTAVANNGARIASGHSPADPVDTEAFGFDQDGNRTYGCDGAWLDLEGLTLAGGEGLSFSWKFISDDDHPYNDFALFVAFAGHAGNVPDGAVGTLAMGGPLAQDRDPHTNTAGNTVWNIVTWRPPGGFSGTVRWLASNGMRLPQGSQPSAGSLVKRRARPPSLLLDCVEIV